MSKHIVIQIMLGAVPVALFFLLLDPFMYWMPASMVPVLLALALVATALFIGYVWEESAADEREEQLLHLAARTGYIAGLAVLAVGCVYQALTNMIDPWLYAALVVMVVTKLAGKVYVVYKSS